MRAWVWRRSAHRWSVRRQLEGIRDIRAGRARRRAGSRPGGRNSHPHTRASWSSRNGHVTTCQSIQNGPMRRHPRRRIAPYASIHQCRQFSACTGQQIKTTAQKLGMVAIEVGFVKLSDASGRPPVTRCFSYTPHNPLQNRHIRRRNSTQHKVKRSCDSSIAMSLQSLPPQLPHL